jgi:hypothetical protein
MGIAARLSLCDSTCYTDRRQFGRIKAAKRISPGTHRTEPVAPVRDGREIRNRQPCHTVVGREGGHAEIGIAYAAVEQPFAASKMPVKDRSAGLEHVETLGQFGRINWAMAIALFRPAFEMHQVAGPHEIGFAPS